MVIGETAWLFLISQCYYYHYFFSVSIKLKIVQVEKVDMYSERKRERKGDYLLRQLRTCCG